MNKCVIHTDGGARGNPGPAGIGVVIEDTSGRIIVQKKKYIGSTTNNQAEYKAVILALQTAKELNAQELEFYLDSELVVEQLNQNYKVKNKELQKLFIEAWNLQQNFKSVSFKHIRREQNKLADQLVNLAIDEALNNN